MAAGSPRTIRELLVRLGVVTDTRKVSEFDSAITSVKRGMKLAVGVAVGLTAALAGVIATTAQAGDHAAKTAQQIGMTAEELQEYEKAARLAGARGRELEVGFRTMARNVRDAAMGQGEAKEALGKLRIQMREGNGELRGMSDIFEQIADRIAGTTNETEKVALASEIFGRSGAKLLPLLNQGAAGIRRMRQEARDLGIVMSEEATKASEEFTDRLGDATDIVVGLKRQIGIGLMPTFTRMLTRFKEWFLANRKVIQQRLDKAVDFIRVKIEDLEDALRRLNEFVQTRLGGWENLFKQIGKALVFGAGIRGLKVAITLLGTLKVVGVSALAALSAAGAPAVLTIGALAVGLGLLLLAGEDFVVFLQGGESAMGRFLGQFGRAEPMLVAIRGLFASIGKLGEVAFTGLLDWGSRVLVVVEAILAPLGGLSGLFDKAALAGILALESWVLGFTGLLDMITLALTDWKEFLRTIVRSVLDELEPVVQAFETLLGLAGDKQTAVKKAGFAGAPYNVAYTAMEGIAGGSRRLSDGVRSLAGEGRSYGGANRPGAVVVNEGDVSISGLGMTVAEADELFRRRDAARERAVRNAVSGGER